MDTRFSGHQGRGTEAAVTTRRQRKAPTIYSPTSEPKRPRKTPVKRASRGYATPEGVDSGDNTDEQAESHELPEYAELEAHIKSQVEKEQMQTCILVQV